MVFSKRQEAAAESAPEPTTSGDAPPEYKSDGPEPPSYDDIFRALTWLREGDLDETISVPMIHRRDSRSLHRLNPFSRKGYEDTPHYITVRKMKRDQYLKHYAKDIDGNYVGTSNPAPDASLVYVPGKSTPQDLLKQLEDTAYVMQQKRGGGIGKFGKPIKE